MRCIAEWLGADPDRWDAITYNFGMWNIGAKNATFCAICIEERTLSQDRLGTHIGKVEKRVAFCAGPDDCNLTLNEHGRYLDQALETYIGGLANITATLLQTRAAKSGKVFFVNTNPTADVKECCTSAPHSPTLAPGENAFAFSANVNETEDLKIGSGQTQLAARNLKWKGSCFG